MTGRCARHVASRVLLRLLAILSPAACAAQDLTPRAYFPAPVSANAVILTYAFATGDIVIDPAIPLTDVTGTVHSPVVSYYHAFSLAGRSANVTGSLPLAIADFRGKVNGEDRAAHRAGAGDIAVRLAVNLAGGPARTPAEFVKATPPRSLLGASLKVLLPAGQYDPTRLINIGSNRWAFKPELGYMRRVGVVLVEAYAGIWLFTANGDFLASAPGVQGAVRTQEPIAAWELHVSHDVTPRLWISGDVNYWRGGRTSVNGGPAAALNSNSRFGVTGSLPLTRRQSLKINYSDGLVVRTGGAFRVLSVAWLYGWLGLPFRKP